MLNFEYKVAILVIEVYRMIPNEMWHFGKMTQNWDVLPESNKMSTLKKIRDFKPDSMMSFPRQL
jgi:hypothetical protein